MPLTEPSLLSRGTLFNLGFIRSNLDLTDDPHQIAQIWLHIARRSYIATRSVHLTSFSGPGD